MRVLQAFCLHLLRRASVRWSLWSLAKYTLLLCTLCMTLCETVPGRSRDAGGWIVCARMCSMWQPREVSGRS